MIVTVICMLYIAWVILVLVLGFTATSMYKGYLTAKGRDPLLIDNYELMILKAAGFPIYIIRGIGYLPFWFGKFLGKMLK